MSLTWSRCCNMLDLQGFCFPSSSQLHYNYSQYEFVSEFFMVYVATAHTMFPTDVLTEKDDSMKLSTGGHIVCSPQKKKPRNESSLYMTPYSTRILSHPIAVIIIGAIGGLLLLLTIGSLFFKPEKLSTCLGE